MAQDPLTTDEALEAEAYGHRAPMVRSSRARGFWLGLAFVLAWAIFAAIYLLSSRGALRICLNSRNFDAPPVEVEILVDGKPVPVHGPQDAISLRIGRHEVQVRAAGQTPVSASVSVRHRETAVAQIDLPVATRKSPRRMVNAQDGSVLVRIPAGPFVTGEKFEGRPKDHFFTIELPAFWLGLTEVTNAQYKRFVEATGHPPPDKLDFGQAAWRGTDFPAELAEHPVAGVSWDDAQAYCRWAGLRLPTELEWEKGARGLDGWEYPWGDVWDREKSQNSMMGAKGTASVRSHPDGRSPWGLYNTSGNVWEWCHDWYDPAAYARYENGQLAPPPSGRQRVTRGGGWNINRTVYLGCSSRASFDPARRDAANGFRVARSEAPTP